ncbi:MAG TPA: hypothetical protein VGI74_18795 [Streptosporangiaceae bacterium]
MDAARIGIRVLTRAAVPLAVTAALSLAWAAQPAAGAAPPGGGPFAARAGTISTVAGGVGGPAQATTIGFPLGGCPMAAAGPDLYIGSGGLRDVNEQSGFLTTVAGTGEAGPPGFGGLATQADLGLCGAAIDQQGNLVIATRTTVSVVAHTTGTFYGQAMNAKHIYRVAGDGHEGFAGDGGTATKAEFFDAEDVAVDPAGNLVIPDNRAFIQIGNERVRVVAERTGTFYGIAMTAGDVYTIAGNGTAGHTGDGGTATKAELNEPSGVAADSTGNALIADTGSNRIRVVAGSTGTFYGRAMTAGDIYTIAGNGSFGFSGDGGPATKAGLNPAGLRLDSHGNLVIADFASNRVRVVAARSGTFYGRQMTAGDIYTIAGNGGSGHTGNGGPATRATLDQPDAVGLDDAGNVVISDSGNSLIRVVAENTGTYYGKSMTAGDIYTIAGSTSQLPGGGDDAGFNGDGGPATAAQVFAPRGAATDSAGDLLIADTANLRIRVVAGSTGTFFGRAMTAGDIYTIAGDGGTSNPSNGVPGTKTDMILPDGVAVDPSGNLLTVGDDDQVQIVAVRMGTFYGQSMRAGFIYGLAGSGIPGHSGDGGPALDARMKVPHGVAVARGSGNLVIADTGNNRVRVVAERPGTYYGIAMTAGDIYDVAGGGRTGGLGDGGLGTKASLERPDGVAVDSAGNLVIADTADNEVRVVANTTGKFYGIAMTAGHIYAVANDDLPAAVAVDGAGNLVIADTGGAQVQVIAETSGTFYGIAMTAGHTYVVAGRGGHGFSGDGGAGPKAELSKPDGVATGPGGSLLIADTSNSRIRELAG